MDSKGVRRGGVGDAGEVARLLHDFNTEFSDPTPGVGCSLKESGSCLTTVR